MTDDLTERLQDKLVPANEERGWAAVHVSEIREAADRIEELEQVLRETVEWLDRTDRNGCAHTEHARRTLEDTDE